MHEVQVWPTSLGQLMDVLTTERASRLARVADKTRAVLMGRTVWNVSSTAQGGGVAEMLQMMVAYGRGVGVDTRWLVLAGDPNFFAITKRLHNLLHGAAGDGGPLGKNERVHYATVLSDNMASVDRVVKRGDIVVLHDPQTAGMVQQFKDRGAHVVWRCHVGTDTGTEIVHRGWSFLRDHIQQADACVFSRRQYAPEWLRPERVFVIPPSLDPLSAKNIWLPPEAVHATLRRAGLLGGADPVDERHLTFTRRDGSGGTVRAHRGLASDGGRVPPAARVVLQVSRWDRLKDMTGVLTAFVDYLPRLPEDVHLVLVGPDVSSVSDDPEASEVLASCRALWRRQSSSVRARSHLWCLPMDDRDENAHLVNALQRCADVGVQKSLAEGFGLTVTEAMWKARPVLASAVGGIADQIVDGISGLLLHDPGDLTSFAAMLSDLLADEERASALGDAAQERVRSQYLQDRQLVQYGELFGALVGDPARSTHPDRSSE